MKRGGTELWLWHFWSLLLQLDVHLPSALFGPQKLIGGAQVRNLLTAVRTEDPAPPKRLIPLVLKSDSSPSMCLCINYMQSQAGMYWRGQRFRCLLFSSSIALVPAQHWDLCTPSSGPPFSLQISSFTGDMVGKDHDVQSWRIITSSRSSPGAGSGSALLLGLTQLWGRQGKEKGSPQHRGSFPVPAETQVRHSPS